MAAEALPQGLHVVAHGPSVLDDAARPFEAPLAVGVEADEARRALNQHGAQHVLELLDAGREARLADTAVLGRLAEIAVLRQRQEIFEFVDHACAIPWRRRARRARRPPRRRSRRSGEAQGPRDTACARS